VSRGVGSGPQVGRRAEFLGLEARRRHVAAWLVPRLRGAAAAAFAREGRMVLSGAWRQERVRV